MKEPLTEFVRMQNGTRCFLAKSRAEELVDRGLANKISESDMRPLERQRYHQIMRQIGETK